MIGRERKERYFQRLEQIQEIESYSPIVIRIREVASNPNASAADLANVILHDHGLTAKVLRLANSAYYSPDRRITTLTHAVVVMGFQAIKNLALSVSIYDTFLALENSSSFNFRHFWVHSVTTAVCSHWLARRTSYPSGEEAFVAGFLHDLGKLIIGAFTPADWNMIQRKIKQGHTPLQAELQWLGTYHTEIGEFVGKKWNFPDPLLNAIRNHHRIGMKSNEKSGDPLMDLIYLANLMAKVAFSGPGTIPEKRNEVKDVARSLYHISEQEMEQFFDSILTRIQQSARELAIPIDEFSIDKDPAEVKSEEEKEQQEASSLVEMELNAVKSKYRDRLKEMQLFHAITRSLVHAVDQDEILTLLAESLFRAKISEKILLLKLKKNTNKLFGFIGFGFDIQDTVKRFSCDISDESDLFYRIVRDNRVLHVADVRQPLWRDHVNIEFLHLIQSHSFAIIPIVVWGRTIALLAIGNQKTADVITEETVRAAHLVSMQAGLALERYIRLT